MSMQTSSTRAALDAAVLPPSGTAQDGSGGMGEKNRRRFLVPLIALALCLVGLVAWIVQMTQGMKVTHMSNAFSWGLYISTFAFFVGIGAGALMLTSAITLFKIKKLEFFALPAALCAFGCILAAGVVVLLDLGSIKNIFAMVLSPNFASPLLWDVIAVTVCLVVSFFLAYFHLLPKMKERRFFLASWAQKRDDAALEATAGTWIRRLSWLGIVFGVAIVVVDALIFSTQSARVWWNTTLMPPDFLVTSVASGTAFVLIVGMVLSWKDGFSELYGGFKLLAVASATALCAHLLFVVVETVMEVWSGTAESMELLQVLFVDYGLLYGFEIVAALIAIGIFFSRRALQNRKTLLAGGILVLLSAFAHKMMLMYPAFNVSPVSFLVPGSGGHMQAYPQATGYYGSDATVFATFFSYVPSLAEWAVILLPVGLILLVLSGATALFNLKR